MCTFSGEADDNGDQGGGINRQIRVPVVRFDNNTALVEGGVGSKIVPA